MHLHGELNGLKEVCRRFNHVITNSVPILKKGKLQWNMFSEHLFRSTDRKFCNVRFYSARENVPSFLQFIRHHHRTLREINYIGCDLTAEEFRETISLVAGSVENLVWPSTLQSNAEPDRVILPKLKSLGLSLRSVSFFEYCGTDSKIFLPKLQNFEYSEGSEEPSDDTRDVLIEFLRSCDRLTTLKIRNSLARRFLTEFTVAPFKFQLKEFALEMYDLPQNRDVINNENMFEFTTPDLPRFLEAQQSSLTHLKLGKFALNFTDLQAVLRLKLVYLGISNCWIHGEARQAPANHTIEKFVFRRSRYAMYLNAEQQRRAIDIVLSCCKRLQSIELANLSLFLTTTRRMSNMKDLTDLELVHCNDLWPLHFPNLQTLTIYKDEGCSDRKIDEVAQLILLNKQLQKIVVPGFFRNNNFFMSVSLEFGDKVEFKD